MRTFAIILILGFVWQGSNASSKLEDMKTCLVENGFTDDIPDLERIQAVGDPEHVDRLKDVSTEKMAGVMACLYERQYGEKSLYDAFKSLVERDDKVSEDERKQMTETLTTCNTNAAGVNVKLLSCVNVLTPPFDQIIAVIRDISDAAGLCFPKCGVTINEMYNMDMNKNKVKGLLQIINEQKLGCFMACIMDEDKKSDSPSFLDFITGLINKSEKHDETQKKEMLETLNKCDTQVAAVENRTYGLIKCVNMFKPPFVDIY